MTGASRGIGRGIAFELASTRHSVAIIHYDANNDAAEETVEQCTALYGKNKSLHAAFFKANIGSAEDRQRLVKWATETFGEIDGLVNNAGIAPRQRDDIIYAKEEIFDEVLKVNLYGPYFLTQLVAQKWLEEENRNTSSPSGKNKTRRIVFITSISAEQVSLNRGEYCISKAGLAMAAQLYSARLAPDNIYVYEIRPGIIATDMTSGVKDRYDKLIAEGLVPQKRWGQPADIAHMVQAIMDGKLDFSTGSVIYADGGLHISRL